MDSLDLERNFPDETSSLSNYYKKATILYIIDMSMNISPMFIINNCLDKQGLNKLMTCFIVFNVIIIFLLIVEGYLVSYYLSLTDNDIKRMRENLISKNGILGRASKIIPYLIKLLHYIKLLISLTAIQPTLNSEGCVKTGYYLGVFSELFMGIVITIVTTIWKKLIAIEGEFYVPLYVDYKGVKKNMCIRRIFYSLGP